MAELVKRIPVGTFIDHGPSVEEREQVQGFAASYAELYGKAKHLVVKPGDKIPITGLDWRIVTAGGQGAEDAAAGRRASRTRPAPAFTPKEITNDPENAQSVGSVVTLGQFRAVDFGDLLWNKEHELMCPNNPIGTIDLFMVSHHGLDQSNSPVLVQALQPRVAVMQNGTRKGAGTADDADAADARRAWKTSGSCTGAYGAGHRAEQRRGLHRQRRRQRDDRRHADGAAASAVARAAVPRVRAPAVRLRVVRPPVVRLPAALRRRAGARRPPPARRRRRRRAPPPRAPRSGAGRGCAAGARVRRARGRGGGAAAHTPAYMIKISARPDGSFTVTNTRNGFSKTYAARPRAR